MQSSTLQSKGPLSPHEIFLDKLIKHCLKIFWLSTVDFVECIYNVQSSGYVLKQKNAHIYLRNVSKTESLPSKRNLGLAWRATETFSESLKLCHIKRLNILQAGASYRANICFSIKVLYLLNFLLFWRYCYLTECHIQLCSSIYINTWTSQTLMVN